MGVWIKQLLTIIVFFLEWFVPPVLPARKAVVSGGWSIRLEGWCYVYLRRSPSAGRSDRLVTKKTTPMYNTLFINTQPRWLCFSLILLSSSSNKSLDLGLLHSKGTWDICIGFSGSYEAVLVSFVQIK